MNINTITISYAFFGILGFLLITSTLYLLTVSIMRCFKDEEKRFNRLNFLFLISWVQLFVVEFIQKNKSFNIQSIVVTFLFLFFMNFLFSLWKKHYRLCINIFSTILFVYSIIQRYVMFFRGSPFIISDISAVGTAMSVAGKYDFTPTKEMLISTIILMFLYLVVDKLKLTDSSKKFNIIMSLLTIIFVAAISFISINRQYLDLIFDVKSWNQTLAIQRNGCLGNLYVDSIFSGFSYPEDYDISKVEEILDNIEIEPIDENKEQAVNIICILEESLFDFNVIQDMGLNEDNLPFYHSLENNTIKGFTNVSAFGGGTANSEYEFLTGGNMLFLPRNVYPFTRYITKNEVNSLASVLKDLDFRTLTFHPFDKNSWSREIVYPLLGFEEYYALEDLTTLKNNEENFLRGTISDDADVDQIIDFYENKKKDEKLFIYNVTIQNHSGYEEDFGLNEIKSSVSNDISLTQYLTLVKKSDEAIEKLITYFDNIDEPTLICIFGDHIPGTIEDILNCSPDFLTGDEKLSRYRTPFLIHANYDIDEEYYENISLSYLPGLVMDSANLPKTKEQTLINSYLEKYPIIYGWGYKYDDTWFDGESLTDDLKIWRDLTYRNLNK